VAATETRIERAPLHTRRGVLRAAVGAIGLPIIGCASPLDELGAWPTQLHGTTWALLGEMHDNPEHHRLRAAVLQRACGNGWRPAIVMEQFDLDRQVDIELARSERPHDAQHLIALAGASRGWHWRDYEAFVALALQYDLPLVAGNLPRPLASRLVREDYLEALGSQRVRAWGLNPAPDRDWQAAQEREIEAGHCGTLPKRLWSGMARAQFARDAAMADQLRRHGTNGAVLLAGNGHVRRDLGVPRWLAPPDLARTLVVGFVERDSGVEPAGRYDALVVTARAERGDPCEAFKAHPQPGPGGLTSSLQRAATG